MASLPIYKIHQLHHTQPIITRSNSTNEKAAVRAQSFQATLKGFSCVNLRINKRHQVQSIFSCQVRVVQMQHTGAVQTSR